MTVRHIIQYIIYCIQNTDNFIPRLTGRCPLDVLLLAITFDPELTNPLGRTADLLSPTWISTGAGPGFPADPSDRTTVPLTASDTPKVTDDCGRWVSVASLVGVVISLVWFTESVPSFTVDVVLEASPFSTAGADFCLFRFFFFLFFAATV